MQLLLTMLWKNLIKIGEKVMRYGRYVIFQLAKIAVPRPMFQ